ncbi:MAG TPA: hypothetical protein VII33_16300, partial [Nakamurella sp.]
CAASGRPTLMKATLALVMLVTVSACGGHSSKALPYRGRNGALPSSSAPPSVIKVSTYSPCLR